jgi:5,10-methylenetetrahydromethanopterin reductase
MRIGIFDGDVVGSSSLDEVIENAREAEEAGLDSFWLPHIFGLDALTALTVVGREVGRIELGTNVVPVYTRHPLVLAQQALSTQVAIGGRLTLGLGLSHKLVIEGLFGMSFDKPARYMREVLSILCPLVEGKSVVFQGQVLQASGALKVPGASPCPVLLAAMGPRMLELAGAMTDGTLLAWTGPKTIRSYVAPAIRAAAEAAGRPAPRIGTALPVCVTDDVGAMRDRARRAFAGYDAMPSYRSMLDREGLSAVGDVALIGGEEQVSEQIAELAAAGVTDLTAVEFRRRGDERERTRALLCSLVKAC